MQRSLWISLVASCLAGCSDGSTFTVSYSAQDPYTDPALLTVDLAWPGGGQHLEGRTFSTTQGGAPHSPVIDVPTRGELRVQAQLVTPDDDTLASAAGTLMLQPGYGYGAGVVWGRCRRMASVPTSWIVIPLWYREAVLPLTRFSWCSAASPTTRSADPQYPPSWFSHFTA